MQEVQRFNKVLKSFVLSGDIILLNLLLWVFGSLWGNRSPFEFSIPEHGFDDFMLSGLQHSFWSDSSSSGGSSGANNASGGTEHDSFCIDGAGAFVHIPF